MRPSASNSSRCLPNFVSPTPAMYTSRCGFMRYPREKAEQGRLWTNFFELVAGDRRAITVDADRTDRQFDLFIAAEAADFTFQLTEDAQVFGQIDVAERVGRFHPRLSDE